MTKPTNSPKIDKLFEKTRPVCFGRFVIDVPAEVKVVHGTQTFGGNITTIDNSAASIKKIVDEKAKELTGKKFRDKTTPYLRGINSPTSDSWTILWSDGDAGKKVGIDEFLLFIRSEQHAYSFQTSSAPSEGRNFLSETDKINHIANHLRARSPDEIPTEPGVCLDLGFIADDTGRYQEIFGIGFRFPSLPDVSLSLSSNKDGQTPEPLSKRRKQAEKLALDSPFAAAFSKVKVMRDGERRIAQWDGEEALFRRPREEGGVWHELRFNYPGIRYDYRNPRLDATLFTGVERNTAGALESSLSDEETIALWDRMLSTLRLRVPAR